MSSSSFTTTVKIPSKQVGVLLADALVETPRDYVTTFAPEWTTVTLSSESREVAEQAEAWVRATVEAIQRDIKEMTSHFHPWCVPLLCSQWGEGALASVEDLYHVEVTFTGRKLPLVAFSEHIQACLPPSGALLHRFHLHPLILPVVYNGEEPSNSSHRTGTWSYSHPGAGIQILAPEDSQKLEEVLLFGGYQVQLSGEHCIVDLDAMTIKTLASGQVATLYRDPPSLRVKPRLEVNIRGLKEHQTGALSNLEERLSKNSKSLTIEFDPIKQEILCHSLSLIVNFCRQYCIEFTLNTTMGRPMTLVIKGADGYASKAYREIEDFIHVLGESVLQQRATAISLPLATPIVVASPVSSPESGIPSTWTPQIADCVFNKVCPVTPEWNDIVSRVKCTIPTVNVAKLDRVQNLALWERYELEGKQMGRRNNGEINQKYLFHGSGDTDPYVIARSDSGIDFRYSSEKRNLFWGSGAYFAENASYSDHFSHKLTNGTKRQMMVVSILTGIPYTCGSTKRPDLKRPPDRAPTGQYDCVKGYAGGSGIYVVYDHRKSCPAYIITYTK